MKVKHYEGWISLKVKIDLQGVVITIPFLALNRSSAKREVSPITIHVGLSA